MSDITDWEPDLNHLETFTSSIECSTIEYRKQIAQLEERNQQLIKKAATLLDEKKSAHQEFAALKSESLTILRVIEACINASIGSHENPLTHRQRNGAMYNLKRIIATHIKELGDRAIKPYDDDF